MKLEIYVIKEIRFAMRSPVLKTKKFIIINASNARRVQRTKQGTTLLVQIQSVIPFYVVLMNLY